MKILETNEIKTRDYVVGSISLILMSAISILVSFYRYFMDVKGDLVIKDFYERLLVKNMTEFSYYFGLGVRLIDLIIIMLV